MSRLTRLLLATCLVAVAALAAAPVGPATASDTGSTTGALELSLDGVHWSSTIPTPLFSPMLRWVPGDVRDATFYVRNTMPDDGAVKLVVERAAQEALLDTGWLSLSARAGDAAWTSIESGGRHVLVDNDRLAGGAAVAVQVRAAFDPAAPNGTMVLASDLDFEVVIADATAVLDEGGTNGGNGGTNGTNGNSNGGTSGNGASSGNGATTGAIGALPGTGSEIPSWLTPFALVLLATGAVLVVRRRTGSDTTEDTRHG